MATVGGQGGGQDPDGDCGIHVQAATLTIQATGDGTEVRPPTAELSHKDEHQSYSDIDFAIYLRGTDWTVESVSSDGKSTMHDLEAAYCDIHQDIDYSFYVRSGGQLTIYERGQE